MESRILVVDDSVTVRMDLAEALGKAGFIVDLADSLAMARKAIAQRPPAIVILDVLLPDGDGIEFLQELRRGEHSIKVMLLSTAAEQQRRVRANAAAPDDYVGKPYSISYMVQRIKELLANNTALDRTLLLIDDSPTVCESMAEQFAELGYTVITAADGKTGLRAAAKTRPAAIIVDFEMPGLSGVDVIRRIRLDPKLGEIPCVLLTGQELADRGELESIEAGADAYVRKSENFEVLAARVEALLRRAARESARQRPNSAFRLLAVDDSPAFLAELINQMHLEPYDVVMAGAGEDALDMLQVQDIDIVLLDLSMPGIGGLETCRRIKAHPHWRNIPVLVLTANDDEKTMLGALAAGADDFVAKSSNFELVRARVRAHLRRKQISDENRRIQDELAREALRSAESEATRTLAEQRARMIAQLESQNEELRGAREAAESATRVRGTFIANMSHEIRTPMNAVLGCSQLLADTLLEAQQQELVSTIRSSGNHLLSIIDDILDFSKIESGHLRLNAEPVNLRAWLEETLDLISQRATDARLSLAYEIEQGTPACLLADSGRLRQVLLNLLSNAVKFTEHGGIFVRAKAHRCIDGEYELRISVRDTGPGIPAGEIGDLFQAFVQLDARARPDSGGTGLGLAISHRLVEMMNGEIWVDSVLGKGSTFSFFIKTESITDAEADDKEVSTVLSGRQILLIEEDPVIAGIARATMESWGLIVNHVVDVKTALSESIDFSRLELAVVNRQALKSDRLRAVPLILAGAISDSDSIDSDTIRIGRPVNRAALRGAILRAIGRQPVQEETRLAANALTNKRILVVEDNAMNRHVAVLMLQSLGHEVVAVEDGALALEAVRQAPYDLVLMDVHMPKVDGLEATRRIRQDTSIDPDLLIVAATASVMEDEQQACLAAGMNAVIAKPIDRSELLKVLASTAASFKLRRPTPPPAEN